MIEQDNKAHGIKLKRDILNYISKLGKTNIHEISKLYHTYSHMISTINDWESQNIVQTEKIGRERIVELTEKGKSFKDWMNKGSDKGFLTAIFTTSYCKTL